MKSLFLSKSIFMKKGLFILLFLTSQAVLAFEDSLAIVKSKNDSIVEMAYSQKGITYKLIRGDWSSWGSDKYIYTKIERYK